jgi:hypothetical protein
MNTKQSQYVTLAYEISLIIGLIAWGIVIGYYLATKPKAPIAEHTTAIYTHYTVYSEHGVAYQLNVDSTLDFNGCDGYDADNDDGHNCVIANTEEIASILKSLGAQ